MTVRCSPRPHAGPRGAPQGRGARVRGPAKVLRGVHPELDQAAVDAVEEWVYEPTVVAGSAVPLLMTVTVRFSLE